jgi:hypothetical protein
MFTGRNDKNEYMAHIHAVGFAEAELPKILPASSCRDVV